ncbi:MAG: uracil-DNA glycosylase [bacterium]|nr:uracil-DNA glycosylase [bacterium]
MSRRDLLAYCNDLGWRDPPEFNPHPERETPPKAEPAPSTSPEIGSLADLKSSIGDCQLCPLCEKRKNVVFGEGAETAPLMFVGEGPGAEEDRTGRPFVGQAGQLLDAMVFALGFERNQVYIANVVKCRPPGNRDPQEVEMSTCSPFLDRQIQLIKPHIIVALGRIAAHRLTGSTKPMRALRSHWMTYQGTPLLATYHPAYLLRSPKEKRTAWEDMKLVLAKLTE